MSRLTEQCPRCHWQHQWTFHYHGELPVEHPICPSCGADLERQYDFEAREVEGSPQEMLDSVQHDEAGLPLDGSARVLALGKRLDDRLDGGLGLMRVFNVEGLVDIELRPYAHHREGVFGIKVTANVGRSIYSMGLLELIGRLNHQLKLGAVVPHTSAYGLPMGAVELFAFGTEVNLYFQHVIPEQALDDDDQWDAQLAQCKALAAALARRLQHAARALNFSLGVPPSREGFHTPSANPEPDELGYSDFGSMRLEDVRETFLEALMVPEPDAEELLARMEHFLETLGLGEVRATNGELHFGLDSARVTVSVIERAGRRLVRYHAALLTGVDLSRFDQQEQELPAQALTALNDQIVAGRCLIEPESIGVDNGPSQIVFEKTLLGADLDLSEFALTLAMVAEEADRMDNILQETFGGLRADQLQSPQSPTPIDLQALMQQLAAHGLPDARRVEVEDVRRQVREMLEEIRVPAQEDEHGDFWFTHGSARFAVRVWRDERATYITLRSRVLRDVARTTGLAEALNDINRQGHFGAFVFKDGRHVDLLETLLADDISIEELTHALVSIGQLADLQDNILQELFGGSLASE